MKIAVLGAGAMGLLFGGLLSRRNEVCIYGHHAEKTDDLKKNGVLIREKDGAENHFFPQAAVSGESSGETPDVVMLFTGIQRGSRAEPWTVRSGYASSDTSEWMWA